MESMNYDKQKMDSLYKPSDPFCSPFECHDYNTGKDPFPISLHWHYFAELIIVKEGTLKITRRDKQHMVHAGEVVFIQPLIHHALDYAEDEKDVHYQVIRLDMEQLGELPSYTPDPRCLMLEAEHRHFSMHFSPAEVRNMHLDQLIEKCVSETKTHSYGYDLKIRALLYLIVVNIIRHCIRNGFFPQAPAAQIDPIYTVTSYISRHIDEPLKVEELARFCGLSYPWFARKFHQIYGISCKEYIEKVRIRKVEQYLLFTDCDLNYISQHTGYADCSHLVRDFRKFHEETPVQFRHVYRQKSRMHVQFPQNY